MAHEPSFDQLTRVLRDRPVCVTGGAGFLGAHLVSVLAEHGARITVLDDLSGGDAEAIAELVDRYPEHVAFIHGSVLDPVALRASLEEASLVFHLAALVSVVRSVDDPDRCFGVNAEGTERVAEAARAAGVERWVVASSSAVYGDRAALPIAETVRLDPRSPYAASKAAGEHIVRAWSDSYGLPGVSLRLFNVYGPGQRAHGAYAAMIPAFLKALHDGESPTIFGDGSATRDLVYVDDVTRAMCLAATVENAPSGQAINIGSGVSVAVLEVAERLIELCARSRHVRYAPEREGEVRHSRADVGVAERLLGFRAHTPLARGLARTAEASGCSRAIEHA